MPTFEITSPDGKKYSVTAPAGATEADALARVKSQHGAKPDPDRPFESLSDYWQRGSLPGLVRPIIEGIESRSDDLTGKGKPIGSTETSPQEAEAVMALNPASVARGSGKAISAIADAIRKPSPQKMLREGGVMLTPGQSVGGIGRRMEEWFQSAPILGSFMRNAKKQTIESFDVSVLNDSLAHINRQVPKGTDAGHDALRFADKAFDERYERVKGDIRFHPGGADGQFAQELKEISEAVKELPPERQQQYVSVMQRVFSPQSRSPDGFINGEQFKRIESDLTRIASEYRASADPDHRIFAHRLDEVKLALRSQLARVNPEVAEELSSINAGYAKLVRAQGAAARRASSLGLFTPSDLLQTIKSLDGTVRKTGFANGDALMQKFAEAGQEVLPNTVPDSGTVERGLFLGATYGAYHLLDPNLLAASGLMSLPYTGPGMRAMNAMAGSKSAWPRPPGAAVSPAAASVLSQPEQMNQ